MYLSSLLNNMVTIRFLLFYFLFLLIQFFFVVIYFQELGDADPLTLAQVHEHLVRSPPPASWPNSTAFQFPSQDTTPNKNDTALSAKSPSKTPSHRNEHELSRSEPSTDIRGKSFKENIYIYIYKRKIHKE